jgi:hypothetical protein
MGSIELKMAILTGAVGGLIMVLAEGVALHRKLSKYRLHLRGLLQAKRFVRVLGEMACIGFIVLIQPIALSLLVVTALDNFDPRFSTNAMTQLRQGIRDGELKDDRLLRHHQGLHP